MRCHICDRVLDDPKIDPNVGEFDPCNTCMEVIQDAVGTFTDKPAADEEALGIDPLWDEIFPPMYAPFDED